MEIKDNLIMATMCFIAAFGIQMLGESLELGQDIITAIFFYAFMGLGGLSCGIALAKIIKD